MPGADRRSSSQGASARTRTWPPREFVRTLLASQAPAPALALPGTAAALARAAPAVPARAAVAGRWRRNAG